MEQKETKKRNKKKLVSSRQVLSVVPLVVSYSASATITRNFQSLKVQVGISIPVYDGDVEKAFSEAVNFVESKLSQKIGEVNYLTEERNDEDVL